MTNRKILVGSLALLSVLIGCGDDDQSNTDAGADASDDASAADSGNTEAGRGGTGGGGRGGSSGASGRGGSGGGGAGGASGRGGTGGTGGTSGSGATKYRVGGQVSGLTGTGLVLQNNGGDDLTVSEAGDFAFETELEAGADYAVTVKTQPSVPTQACTLAMGSGTVGTADVTNVQVTCTTTKFTIGGTITGLTGAGLKLKNNGGDELTLTGSTFTFGTSVDSGASYAVTISAQPSGQACGVASGTGDVGPANVENVAVTCYANPVLAVDPRFAAAIGIWANTGASSYTLKGTTSATCDVVTMSCPGAVELANAVSPAPISGLTDGTVYYFQLIAAHAGGVTAASNKTATRPNRPRLDGSVHTLATAGGVTYAGGAFSRLSVHAGAAIPVNKTTGFPSDLPNFPIIDGDVLGLAADGTGGYYVGGTFNDIGGETRDGLAHIKADGTLDADWTPAVTGGWVRTIAVNNGTVYVAGDFTNIGGQARAGLAAIGTSGVANGVVSMAWNPNPTGGSVSAIAFWQNDVVVGGGFTDIVATAQPYLAMLDGTTAALRPWAPNPDFSVSALAVNADTIYAGGEFRNIGTQPRDRIAALNATGTDAGKATTWDPSANNAVTQLSFANNTVYIAGAFTSIGATPDARDGVAAIDAADGTVKAWNPVIAPVTGVSTLVASVDTVYIAGTFTSVNSTARNGAAAVSSTDAATVTGWDPNPDGTIQNLAFVGDSVVLGGLQRGLRGIERKHLAAFDASGNVTSWNPGADNDVHALAVSGTTVYVGGEFGTLAGMTRDNVGAVDTAGTLSPWNPEADGAVYALALTNDAVFAGGSFQNVGATPTPRARLAAFSLAGSGPGTLSPWDPGADGPVRALAINGTNVYVGGDFALLDGESRNRIGAVGIASGAATGWDPNITGTGTVTARALAATADTVYAGGEFTTVGVTGRANFVALSTDTATPTPWQPNPNGAVYALLLANDFLYLAGEFTSVDTSANRNRYAVYGGLAGTPAIEAGPDYIRNFDQAVRALSPGAGGVIYAGGDFTDLDGVFTSSFGAVVPGGP